MVNYAKQLVRETRSVICLGSMRSHNVLMGAEKAKKFVVFVGKVPRPMCHGNVQQLDMLLLNCCLGGVKESSAVEKGKGCALIRAFRRKMWLPLAG